MKSATLFSGFDGVGIGMQAAGLSHVWGIEYDDQIASVARLNGFNTHTLNILEADPALFEPVDVLHASPPCPNFSVAKTGAEETPHDIALARKVADFIEVIRPKHFTLENVYAYRNSQSWQIISSRLYACGYWLDMRHVNFADYGIMCPCPLHDLNHIPENVHNAGMIISPDSKMIAPDIVAVLAGMHMTAQANHLAWDAVVNLVKVMSRDIAVLVAWQRLAELPEEKKAQIIQTGKVVNTLTNADIFESELEMDINESIALLLRTCLTAPLLQKKWYTISTETQKITIQKILECILVTPSTQSNIIKKEKSLMGGRLGILGKDCPICDYKSVPQTRQRMIVRAVHNGFVPYLPKAETWRGWYQAIEDLIPTLPPSEFAPWQLARLPDEINTLLFNGMDMKSTIRQMRGRTPNEPSATVIADDYRRPSTIPSAFIANAWMINSENAGQEWGGTRYGDEPSMTISTGSKPRAFIVDDQNGSFNDDGSRGLIVMDNQEPMFTVAASQDKRHIRAWPSQGRVVEMPPRALARFQSFPDWYKLPEKPALACKGIGNAVPPLGMEKIYRTLFG